MSRGKEKKNVAPQSRRKSAIRKEKAESLLSEARSALADAFNSSRASINDSAQNVSGVDSHESDDIFADASSENDNGKNEAEAGNSIILQKRIDQLLVKLDRTQIERDVYQKELEKEKGREQQWKMRLPKLRKKRPG